jgi:predicted NUDIX family NTP pyrophosphohydrolase
MGKKRNAYRILVGKPEGSHWEDQDVGGWTILKWILER